MTKRQLSDLVPVKQFAFVIAESGTGKTSFIKQIIANLSPETPVFIHTREPSDFSGELSTRIQFLQQEFTVHENFFTNIPTGAYVFLDDFTFSRASNKNDKLAFSSVVNYYLRHHKITLFLIIHNLTGHNLFTEILLAPHIFLAYSSLGYYAIRKLQPKLGDKSILTFYQEIPQHQFHFLYINCQRNYLINSVDNLFNGKSTTMYLNKQVFVIHPKNKPCNQPKKEDYHNSSSSDSSSSKILSIDQQISDFLQSTYPKQKHLPYVFNILNSHNLFDKNLFFVQFSNIHIADLCAFLNNRFGKTDSTDSRFIKLCKYLQSINIKLPKIAIKNPVAVKYLCS